MKDLKLNFLSRKLHGDPSDFKKIEDILPETILSFSHFKRRTGIKLPKNIIKTGGKRNRMSLFGSIDDGKHGKKRQAKNDANIYKTRHCNQRQPPRIRTKSRLIILIN